MTVEADISRLAIFLPALGALLILAADSVSPPRAIGTAPHRADALAGIRIGSLAALTLAGVWVALRADTPTALESDALFSLDLYAIFGIVFVTLAGLFVLGLSLTHFGMARSRPAEPAALLLFSMTGMTAAIATTNLLVIAIALELVWLPVIALIAIDSRRLSSSESSLKTFFAGALASVLFAAGVCFVFGATGDFDGQLGAGPTGESRLIWEVGVTLVLTGLIARSALAPFHPWYPDAHEGAPSFVTAHIATGAIATTFLVLLRLLMSLEPGTGGAEELATRAPQLFGALGCLALVWGHAMALVQVGLRRLLGWLGVGQIGFFAMALVDARGDGGPALLYALIASAVATIGVLAILSSLSHHERACESVGDLSGMMKRSPIRAGLFALFLLSLGGFPGTMGFVARLEVLGAIENAGDRWLLAVALGATALALTAVGRPLLTMLRPLETTRAPSRALTNEQVILAVCGLAIVYFGFAPAITEGNLANWLADWIEHAVASLRN